MRFHRQITVAALIAATALSLSLSAFPAQAAYVVTLKQEGTEVVASGSGAIDTTDLTFDSIGAGVLINITPQAGAINTGPFLSGSVDTYSATLAGPTEFGPGGQTTASDGSGDTVGIALGPSLIFLPAGYVSGGLLTDSATYSGQTLGSLGVTPGKYVWTWGSGADADSFTLVAGVPEPSTWVMALLGFASLGYAGYRTQRARAAAIAA